ncbi:MAG: hypothetical protein H0W88_09785 [Parachlamydiaceae bacterium]|nr:hypothetical protein [Parachlamydiaceae bacterium]
MTSPHSEKKIYIDFEKEFYKDILQTLITPTSEKFQKILKSFSTFNLFFCALIAGEVFYLLFHLTFLVQGFVLAIHLALVFATVFSFFTLRLYFQTKKAEKFVALKNDFINAVKSSLNFQENNSEHHLTIASMCCKLAVHLHDQEYKVYSFGPLFNFIAPSIEKLSCWCHWQDVHFMKEMLLNISVDEHIKLVKSEPTNLEVHAGLANAYVILSGLYVDPRTIEGHDDERWIPHNKYQGYFKQKFRLAAERAIEEFKILSAYAPNDPWVYAQLAFSYHDLQMPKEEIKAYETILELCPEDKETLFKLGRLYFEQGLNAKGLQLYENLKKSNYNKAESLIHYYGDYSNSKQFDSLTVG